MSIQDKALQSAINLLKIAHVPYGVILPDGTTVATEGYEFRLIPPPPAAPVKAVRRFNVPLGFYRDIYYPALKDAQPGQTIEIPAPEGVDVEALRSAACGWCSKHWGGKSYMSEASTTKRIVTFARIN